MSKRPVSGISGEEGEGDGSPEQQQQQQKKAKISHSDGGETILHGLKKGMEILVKWELVDDEADPEDPNAVARVWWPATVESISKETGDAVLSYTGHGSEYPAEVAAVKVEADHTLRDTNGVPQDWKEVPSFKAGEELGGDVTCPRGHASRLLTWGARREAMKKERSGTSETTADDAPLVCDVCLTISSDPAQVVTHCTDCGDWITCRYCIAAWRRTGEWPLDADVKKRQAEDAAMEIGDLIEMVGNEMSDAPEAVQSAAHDEFGELPAYQQQILATGFRTFIDTFKAELRKFSATNTARVITEKDMRIILDRCRDSLKSAMSLPDSTTN
ncbi:hypothetical protein FOZ62_002138 [Perkinsus olseni]|uniref:Uncharacterized protein n=1 Tax=Perkinsus olseni TaxID=32597 RepID=A0A7J6R861_PEROL|nr:hypothetical protein FOZ62_002138 [Perkinsus olseni]